jgi:hypothetical protein
VSTSRPETETLAWLGRLQKWATLGARNAVKTAEVRAADCRGRLVVQEAEVLPRLALMAPFEESSRPHVQVEEGVVQGMMD